MSGKNLKEHMVKEGVFRKRRVKYLKKNAVSYPLKKPVYINSFFVVIFSHE